MNIYKTFKQIISSLKSQKVFHVLLAMMVFTFLAACSGTEPVVTETNSNEPLSETEPVEIDINNEDPLSETEINPLQELFAESEGKIAFWTNRDGNGEIYLMDADGGNHINLTNNDADEYGYAWSPDGSKIAFTSNRDSDYENTGTWVTEIYIMNADGSEQTRLTNNDISESSVAWSPDGEKIIFDTNWDKVKYDNSILNWLGLEIGVMDADGSNMIRLTNNGYRDDHPSWSPDGRKIVFASDRDGEGSLLDDVPNGNYTGSYVDLVGDREIYVMDPDGSNVVRLTYDNWSNSSPAWSPDGKKIAFNSERDGIVVICLMNADGSNVNCLQNNDAIVNGFKHAFGPAWSPDGNWIAFSTNGFLGKEIYIMNANGTVNYRIVEGGVNGLPIWQP
jgi:Tol biopolymer transport system component